MRSKIATLVLSMLALASVALGQPLPPNPGTGLPPIVHTDATFRNLGSSALTPGQCVTVAGAPNYYLVSTGAACGSSGGGGISAGTGIVLTGGGTVINLIVPVAASLGGSGIVSPTAHSVPITEGSSAFDLVACSSGQFLAGVNSSDPTCRALTSSDLPTTGVGAGSCTSCNLSYNAQGQITSAANGSGGGAVTSVGLTVPSYESVSGSPVTSSGTLAVTLNNENANTLFAGPVSGSATSPTFRAGDPSDFPGTSIRMANDASTGTTLNKLVKIKSGSAPVAAIISSAGDTTGAIGTCIQTCGTSSNAVIQQNGTATCVFDNQTVAGDFVQISTSVAGDCTDAGATYPTAGGEVLGVVTVTNASVGSNPVNFFTPDVVSSTPGGGTGNQLAAWLQPTRTTVSGSTQALNLKTSGNQFVLLNHSTTFSFSHPPPQDGWVVRFKLTQGSGGNFTVAWPATVSWSGASAPTLTTTAGQADWCFMVYDANTGNYGGASCNFNDAP